MDKKTIEHMRQKLLQNPRREMQSDGSIKEIYDQPERSKREDALLTTSMETPVFGFSKGMLTKYPMPECMK